MKHRIALAVLLLILLSTAANTTSAQTQWSVGGNMGISIYDGSAGFHIGPMSEVIFNRGFAVGSEFNINTQGGTPLE